MEILQVRITNFLAIKKATVHLNDRGLVLIQGENKDDPSAKSNGAGKSSIPDAICWALYGETARGVSGDAVVNNIAKKDCCVMVEIRDGDDRYLITRYRRHHKHKNELHISRFEEKAGKEYVPITFGTAALTQDFINTKILGCSLEVFRAAVYAGQEAMPDLPGMTDKMLKLLVEEAAGVTRLQKAHELANQHLAECKSKEEKVRERVEALRKQRDDLTAEKASYEAEFDKWERERAVRIRAAEEAVMDAETRVAALHAKVLSYDEKKLNRVLANLDAALAARKSQETKRDELAQEVQDLRGEYDRLDAASKIALRRLKEMRDALTNIESKVGSPCGECGKVYEKGDLEAAYDAQKRAVLKHADECKRVQKDAAAAKARYEDAQQRLKDFEASMTDVSKVAAQQKLVRDKLAEFEGFKNRLKTAQGELELARNTLTHKKSEGNPYKATCELTARKLADTERELTSIEKLLVDIEWQTTLARDAVQVFSRAGVRAHILDQVTPFLNARTADYLGALSDGNIHATWNTLARTAKGELKEKFNIEVVNEKGAKSFAGLSGGEKRKVRLACAMALQDLVASRATKPIRLFIADEVDHALDEAGLERLMGILDAKARERGTVLVISHNELSDWIREQVTVTKEDGVSTVSGVLC